MKKLIAVILCVGLCLGLFGCGTTSEKPSDDSDPVQNTDRFVKVQDDVIKIGGSYFDIYVDTETSVMYICVVNSWGIDVEPLMDADGNPLLWEGELK